MEKIDVEVVFVARDEFGEARLMMSGEQFHPGRCDRLVVEVGNPEVRGVFLYAVADQRERFLERHSMEQKPGQPQVISVAERCSWKLTTGERREEFIITDFSGSNDDSHGKMLTESSTISGGLQLEELRVAAPGPQQFLVSP